MSGGEHRPDRRCQADVRIPGVDILSLEPISLCGPCHLQTFLNQIDTILLNSVSEVKGIVDT